MRSKLNWASAVALAATLFTALFSAQGSGAAAEARFPEQATQESRIQFVSSPVVQPLPVETGANDDSTPSAPVDEGNQGQDAASLSELVALQDIPETLSPELRCLAAAIYFEARGESQEGQLAVGRVIINRAKSGRFPSSYCGVVYQPAQFSFVRGRSMPAVREGSAAWRSAVAIAQIADDGLWNGPAQGALFFHAARVSPGWRLTRLARVDNHVFYR